MSNDKFPHVMKTFDIVTFLLPRLSSIIFFPSFGVLLVAAFPRMKFCGKIRNKNNEKEIFMDPTLCFIYYLDKLGSNERPYLRKVFPNRIKTIEHTSLKFY
jgi:hypothetical protein